MKRSGSALRAAAAILLWVTLSACGDARHEPVRVIAQPRAEPPAALPVVPAPPVAPAASPAPAASVAASAPAAPPARGLDAGPAPGLAGGAPPQRRWQPGEPNGNADFRAALEARQNARGQPPAAP